MSINNIQKQLIEKLTQTHNNPKTAYLAVLSGCKSEQDKEQVKKIAKKYKIEV